MVKPLGRSWKIRDFEQSIRCDHPRWIIARCSSRNPFDLAESLLTPGRKTRLKHAHQWLLISGVMMDDKIGTIDYNKMWITLRYKQWYNNLVQ